MAGFWTTPQASVVRKRWEPQRSEQERQGMIAELRRLRRLGLNAPEQRRIEFVLRLDWDHGWPEGESVAEDPLPLVRRLL